MNVSWIALAVPLFVGLMYVEYRVSLRRRLPVHRFHEAVANLNVGMAERLTDLFTSGLFFFVFEWLYHHFAWFSISAHWYTWLFLFLLTDFVWYWYHRAGHRVNLFWGVHVVHHQSEDFNYTTSARITVFQALARGLFWSVLPIVGFPPHMIATLLLVHGAYPFFTHTQLVGKLGILEYFLVTPSHHRVHHASNPEYLDKNYGDVLIVWDKLFGTFAEERAEPSYGLTTPLNSHSFLWQHFHFLLEIGVAFSRARGFRARFRTLFGKPDDIDPRIRAWLEKKFSNRNEFRPVNAQVRQLVRMQTGTSLVLLFLLLFFAAGLTGAQVFSLSVFILLSLINSGAILEQRRWVFYLDFLRLVVAGCAVYTFCPHSAVLSFTLGGATIVLLFYKTLQRAYCRWLFGVA
ncbi:sterol desaturase family protein [Flaviaesturariibacter aridisoli]|uniref:Sterol desaturase family protein n=1 Tax=Flaviaesturariibacter aridisoli TaxID=2545761 RepID=A0A4R4DWG3_9BACT|nr:sterol desaturase family protein [Flaviaesturariibacter aridisoli]TCZ68322.1 sterol desaturase family protein [Flaviaesturariibacter aridisoli]